MKNCNLKELRKRFSYKYKHVKQQYEENLKEIASKLQQKLELYHECFEKSTIGKYNWDDEYQELYKQESKIINTFFNFDKLKNAAASRSIPSSLIDSIVDKYIQSLYTIHKLNKYSVDYNHKFDKNQALMDWLGVGQLKDNSLEFLKSTPVVDQTLITKTKKTRDDRRRKQRPGFFYTTKFERAEIMKIVLNETAMNSEEIR